MFKQLLSGLAVFVAAIGFACAQVDVNKADQAALDGIKGIGPKASSAIIEGRKKGGDYKNWDDFESRVKGIRGKNSMKLSQAGLTVNGESRPNAPAADSKEAKKATKTAAAKNAKSDAEDVKKDIKKEEPKK